MSEPTINEELTQLVRDFIAAAKEKIHHRIGKTDPEKLAEKVIGTLMALLAGLRIATAALGKRGRRG